MTLPRVGQESRVCQRSGMHPEPPRTSRDRYLVPQVPGTWVAGLRECSGMSPERRRAVWLKRCLSRWCQTPVASSAPVSGNVTRTLAVIEPQDALPSEVEWASFGRHIYSTQGPGDARTSARWLLVEARALLTRSGLVVVVFVVGKRTQLEERVHHNSNYAKDEGHRDEGAEHVSSFRCTRTLREWGIESIGTNAYSRQGKH